MNISLYKLITKALNVHAKNINFFAKTERFLKNCVYLKKHFTDCTMLITFELDSGYRLVNSSVRRYKVLSYSFFTKANNTVNCSRLIWVAVANLPMHIFKGVAMLFESF